MPDSVASACEGGALSPAGSRTAGSPVGLALVVPVELDLGAGAVEPGAGSPTLTWIGAVVRVTYAFLDGSKKLSSSDGISSFPGARGINKNSKTFCPTPPDEVLAVPLES